MNLNRRMNRLEQLKSISETSLEVLDTDDRNTLTPIVHHLLEIIFRDLQAAQIGNPLEHHPIVMGHMLKITTGEASLGLSLLRSATLSLLHDISAVPKITTQMVDDLREEDPEKADALDLTRKQNRILHMREGSAMAHRRMLELNASCGRIVFDAHDIDAVCEAIRIHDNPSLNIPIPRTNSLAMAFREADRLWMVTPEGIRADLIRKNKDVRNSEACLRQLESNVQRFKDERTLYSSIESTEGPFCDDETLFRTGTGHAMFQRLCNECRDHWDATH